METKLENSHLWKITHPTSDKVSYLFGTMHELLNPEEQSVILTPLFASLIFDSIDLVITEVGDLKKLLNEPEFKYKSSSDRAKIAHLLETMMESRITKFANDKNIPILKIENYNRAETALGKSNIGNAEEKSAKFFKPKNIAKGVAIGLTLPMYQFG